MLAAVSDRALAEIVARALAEDVGSGDVTTAATVAEDARARALITQKAPGVVFGLDARGGDVSAARPGDRAASAWSRRAAGATGGPVMRRRGLGRERS